MKRKNRRRRKSGKDRHRFPLRDGKAKRFPRLECDAVGNDARVVQFRNDAVTQITLAFARASREQNDIGLR